MHDCFENFQNNKQDADWSVVFFIYGIFLLKNWNKNLGKNYPLCYKFH